MRGVLSRIPRLWPESTIVCIGTGPSLTSEDLDVVGACPTVHTIVVNDAYKLAPWADVLYAADGEDWWQWHASVPRWKLPPWLVTIQPEARQWRSGVIVLQRSGEEGVDDRPTHLRTGGHSGYQAVNLAMHYGAKTIITLGYDMQSKDGVHHATGEHPPHPNGRPRHLKYETYLPRYAGLYAALSKRGITLINASRETAITSVPRMALADALAC